MIHPSPEVQNALDKLSDALVSWERDTGIQSVLIIREKSGFVYRAASGKPGVPDDISDDQLLATVQG